NSSKSIHGGMITSLVDFCGALVIASKEVHPTTLSMDINVSYVASVRYGDTIIVNTECVTLDKTFAFTTVEVHNKADGR
ncbi:37114_t:CDS:2, partial [Gigaspora margarita]